MAQTRKVGKKVPPEEEEETLVSADTLNEILNKVRSTNEELKKQIQDTRKEAQDLKKKSQIKAHSAHAE